MKEHHHRRQERVHPGTLYSESFVQRTLADVGQSKWIAAEKQRHQRGDRMQVESTARNRMQTEQEEMARAR